MASNIRTRSQKSKLEALKENLNVSYDIVFHEDKIETADETERLPADELLVDLRNKLASIHSLNDLLHDEIRELKATIEEKNAQLSFLDEKLNLVLNKQLADMSKQTIVCLPLMNDKECQADFESAVASNSIIFAVDPPDHVVSVAEDEVVCSSISVGNLISLTADESHCSSSVLPNSHVDTDLLLIPTKNGASHKSNPQKQKIRKRRSGPLRDNYVPSALSQATELTHGSTTQAINILLLADEMVVQIPDLGIM